MILTPQRTAILPCLAALGTGLSACSDAQVESARAACTVTLQALYRPMSESEPVTFEPVANVSQDSEKFEFVWKESQIKNVLFHLSMADIAQSQPDADGRSHNYRVVIEGAGGTEREYRCRGSLKVRSLHGIWVRQTSASGHTNDFKVTKYPISY